MKKSKPKIPKYSTGGGLNNQKFNSLNTKIEKASSRSNGLGILSKGASLINPFAAATIGIGGLVMGQISKEREEEAQRKMMRKQEAIERDQALIGAEMDENFTLPEKTFKNGGKIKGKGTGKSDSISANLDVNGFVVPAENERKANQLRKLYFPGTESQKADIKSGNKSVKISNGEHYFTPEEVAVLTENGIDLNKLAPNAKPGDKMENGGKVTISGTEYKTDSLRVHEFPSGKKVIYVIDSNNNALEKIEDKQAVESVLSAYKIKDANIAKGKKDSVNIRTMSLPQFRGAEIPKEKAKDFNTSKVRNDVFNATFNPDILNITQRNADKAAGYDRSSTRSENSPDSPSASKKSKENILSVSDAIKNDESEPITKSNTSPMEKRGIPKPNTDLPKKLSEITPDEMNQLQSNVLSTPKVEDPTSNSKLSKLPNVGTILGVGQSIIGATQLFGQKDEPVIERNKDLITRLSDAMEDEKTGFDAAEKQELDNRISTNKNTGVRAAHEFSGGNRFAAFTNNSAALQGASDSNIKVAAADAKLKRAKKFRTDRILQLVDADNKFVTRTQQEKFRRDQDASAGLLNSGISNILTGFELDRIDKRARNRNSPIDYSSITKIF